MSVVIIKQTIRSCC